jgi:predicted NUDIX family phosphoesterase
MSLQQQQAVIQKHAEEILVVPRTTLIDQKSWHGIKPIDMQELMKLITAHKEFHPRYLMEEDERYKQIIPYLIFMHNEHIFLMQRHAQATEKRLQNKYTIGIGGHIRKEDLEGQSIIDWARREFEEEVSYTNTLSITPIGLLNDDTNPVGRVHIGVVFLLQGTSDQIAIKSELAQGTLVPLSDYSLYQERLETWSQLAWDFIITHHFKSDLIFV